MHYIRYLDDFRHDLAVAWVWTNWIGNISADVVTIVAVSFFIKPMRKRYAAFLTKHIVAPVHSHIDKRHRTAMAEAEKRHQISLEEADKRHEQAMKKADQHHAARMDAISSSAKPEGAKRASKAPVEPVPRKKS